MLTRQDMTGVQAGAPTKLVLGFHHAGYLDWKPAVVASNREEFSDEYGWTDRIGGVAWLPIPSPGPGRYGHRRIELVETPPTDQFLHPAWELIDTRMACHDSGQEAHMTCLFPRGQDREAREGGGGGGGGTN